jgi:hypothetical protein
VNLRWEGVNEKSAAVVFSAIGKAAPLAQLLFELASSVYSGAA